MKDIHSSISPPMRNSMLSSQQEMPQRNQSQQVFELPARMNAPSEMSHEREPAAGVSKSRERSQNSNAADNQWMFPQNHPQSAHNVITSQVSNTLQNRLAPCASEPVINLVQ